MGASILINACCTSDFVAFGHNFLDKNKPKKYKLLNGSIAEYKYIGGTKLGAFPEFLIELYNEWKNSGQTKEKKEPKPKKDNKKVVLTQSESVSQLKESIDNENSQKFYDNNIKTLAYILDCDDFNKCLKNAKMVIYKIESAKQKKDPSKVYSINSKKAIYQSILKMVDGLGIPLSKNARELYLTRYDSLGR
jgi:hypothetical protein